MSKELERSIVGAIIGLAVGFAVVLGMEVRVVWAVLIVLGCGFVGGLMGALRAYPV